MSFYERYERCCKDAGILPASQSAADQLGCTRGNISQFAKREITPKGDIVAGAARMFNVSADYLLGLIDAPRKIDDSVTAEEAEVINLIRQLNKEGYDTAIGVIKGLTLQEEYKRRDDGADGKED